MFLLHGVISLQDGTQCDKEILKYCHPLHLKLALYGLIMHLIYIFCFLATSQAHDSVWTKSHGCFTSHGPATTGLEHSDWVIRGNCLHFIGSHVTA